jgi:predicted amidohydrolase YtcJ
VADLLIRNTRLVPIEPRAGNAAPGLSDVLVEDGKVTGVGEQLDRPASVEEIDADGRWCIPGLWDQHVHLTQWTLTAQRLDLAGTRSPEQVLAAVGARVSAASGQPVIGWGHRSGGWSREVTVAELDVISGETPVVLVSGDGHHAWLNTAGLHALGLPAGNSVVRENEWFAAYPRLNALTGDRGAAPAAFRDALNRAAALGIVGLVDFEFNAGLDEWTTRWTQGCDRLRIRWATYAGTLDDVVSAGLRTGDPLDDDARLTMGPLKIISDGSLNTRTAWCGEPYAMADDLEYPYGRPNLTADELHDLLARAHAHGLAVAVHAIGDAAVRQAVDAFADTGARGSIEHAQLVRWEDVPRLAGLGLRASVQPAHLLDDRDVTEHTWPGRAERCFAFAWMLDAGVELALGSDAPVSPLDPWLAMAAAVHRSADERPAWHAEQALTPAQALAASVDGQPTVGVGSRGDLVLLDADPLVTGATTAETATALRAMPVGLTVVAGAVVHTAL